ncbi:hypothetical protein CRG98_048973 [Punica granatum]|uniref:Uncharacterized protein n=1 Tax=Punica granatum TaxID=22663 RepID=A0A2I0HH05_PUNGR|nr:hypothetical protein CRG98_048973 [Punica granatum]
MSSSRGLEGCGSRDAVESSRVVGSSSSLSLPRVEGSRVASSFSSLSLPRVEGSRLRSRARGSRP